MGTTMLSFYANDGITRMSLLCVDTVLPATVRMTPFEYLPSHCCHIALAGDMCHTLSPEHKEIRLPLQHVDEDKNIFLGRVGCWGCLWFVLAGFDKHVLNWEVK